MELIDDIKAEISEHKIMFTISVLTLLMFSGLLIILIVSV